MAADEKGLNSSWIAEGPAPIEFGQTEGATTNREATGAVNAVAPHPTNANVLYVGGANGGIWRTNNALSASPNWTSQTDNLDSLSIGDIAFDPADTSHQTLVAGVARSSSLRRVGGARIGVLRTTNGGNTWNVLPGMAGRNVIGVAPMGNTIVAAVDIADSFNCGEIGIFRSTNAGASWSRVTNGFPGGSVDGLAQDPVNTSTLYASVVFADSCSPGGEGGNPPPGENGIYKSLDGGASWFKSSPAPDGFPLDGFLESDSRTHVEMAVGNADNFYVAIVPGSTGELASVFYTPDGGAFWFQMDLPGSFEPDFFGIHPGGQGNIHLSLAVDPVNPAIVYVGGDRQPGINNDEDGFPSPNSVGARNFSGRLFRGDVSVFEVGEWAPLTHVGTSGNSSPHADSRNMAFDANGNLIEGDDGGVYRRSSPRGSGDWFTVNGNLQITETHSGAYDSLSDIVIGGNQDNGSTEQLSPAGLRWVTIRSGDGGDVDVVRVGNQSVRYASAQNLANFYRAVYDSSNNFVSGVFPALTVIGGNPLEGQFITPIAANTEDSDRLLIGADNGLYESFDQGDTIEEISPGLRVNGRNGSAMSYGSRGNADIAYVGACIGVCADSADGADGLYVRSGPGQTFNHVFPAGADGEVTHVTVDPDVPSSLFLLNENATIWRTDNTGQSFSEITGNLNAATTGALHSLVYISSLAGDALAVGTDKGVFIAFATSNYSSWSGLGNALPNAPVYDLRFDPERNKLVASTLGRGSYSLSDFLNVPDLIFVGNFELAR